MYCGRSEILRKTAASQVWETGQLRQPYEPKESLTFFYKMIMKREYSLAVLTSFLLKHFEGPSFSPTKMPAMNEHPLLCIHYPWKCVMAINKLSKKKALLNHAT